MKFGIESFILIPPFSLFVSLLLFFGITQIGKKFLEINQFKFITDLTSHPVYIAPIFGSLIILIFLMPTTLLGLSNLLFLRILATIIILFGIFFVKKINFFQFKKFFLFPEIILLFYFLLTFSPITSGDSIDYHSNIAIHILNYGSLPTDHYWFHSRQGGLGEILIALGLSLGGEQFGSLVQFTGLLAIYGILKKILDKNVFFSKNIFLKNLIQISILTSPIYIFLIMTNKPQLITSGFLAICFSLVFLNYKKILKKDLMIFYLTISIILIFSFYIKFNTSISAFIISIVLIFKLFRSGINIIHFISVSVLIILVFIFPYSYWKVTNFDLGYLQSLIYPLPINLYGYENLWTSVSSCGYYCGFPYWFFVPMNLSQATQTLGLCSFFLFFLFFLKKVNLEIKVALLFYLLVFLSFGQHNARFFLDPFIWAIISLGFFYKKNFNKKFTIFSKAIISIQFFYTIVLIFFGIATSSIGSLSESLRTQVLNRSAYNYELASWINDHHIKNLKLLTFESKTAYFSNDTISLFFINYLSPLDERSYYYYNLIKKEKPNHFLLITPNDQNRKKFVEDCLGKKVISKREVGSFSGRNPFKINKQVYGAEIYEFKNNLFPKCLK